jgi:large subunit ribosomal protein L23
MSVLIKPLISEKAGMLSTLGKYVFEVTKNATAPEVKKEIEKVYKVKVASVNIIKLPGKKRRIGRTMGKTSSRKKAVLTLVPGHSIAGITEPA